MCRVATPEDEEAWLEVWRSADRARARPRGACGGCALARGGRGVETDEDGIEEVPRETVWLSVTPRVRARWSRARLLARRVAGEALSQAAVAEVIAAEVMSAIGVDGDPGLTTLGHSASCKTVHPSGARAGAREPVARSVCKTACAPHGSLHLPAFLAPLVEGLESADAIELDARLRRALRIERRWLAEIGPLLLEVARSRSYRFRGCSSLAVFAREKLGMSPRKAQALLRLERACTQSPELRAAFSSGRLSWVQAHALIPVLALEHAEPWRAAWVAHAEAISVRRLEEDVERALVTGELDPARSARTCKRVRTPRSKIQRMSASGARPGRPPSSSSAPADVARLFKAVLATVQRRIERRNGRTASESEALDAMLEHCFETWALPNAKVPREHRVFERDGWRCTVPGCSSYRNLHNHHIEYRSDGGPDDPWNRTALCAAHHQRGVHAGIGRIRIRGRAPDGLRFELPLVNYGPGERILR